MNNLRHHQLITPDASGFCVELETHPNPYTPHHWHKAVELVMMIDGTLRCIFESGTRKYRTGELFLINSHEVHETHASRNAKFLMVHIDPAFMCRYSSVFQHLLFSLHFSPNDHDKSAAYEELKQIMQRIYVLTDCADGSAPFEQQSLLFKITAILVEHFSKQLALEESNLHSSDMSRLEPILDYIHLHLGEDLQLEDAASAMGVNKEYFCRLFKKNMGITHLQYIYQLRSAAVCRDLEYTDDPIGEIAQRHGFRDGKTLNHYFKELYGCTPSEKRKFFRNIPAGESSPEQSDG